MSVLAKDRKPSTLRVLTHWMTVRLEFKRLFVFNFGYDKKRLISIIRNEYKVYEKTDEMYPERLELFKAIIKMNEDAVLEILEDSRKFLTDGFRQVEDHMYIANTIYPTTSEELSLRRCHQDEALGICFSMMKELEFLMRCMPIRADKLPRYIEMLNQQLTMLKAWRASNNKFNVSDGPSRRRKKKADSGSQDESQDSFKPTTNSNVPIEDQVLVTNIESQESTITSSTQGMVAPSGKRGFSKGYSYTTGLRQPNR